MKSIFVKVFTKLTNLEHIITRTTIPRKQNYEKESQKENATHLSEFRVKSFKNTNSLVKQTDQNKLERKSEKKT